ncbi:MAG TPA: M15 family metallopeptidase [Patescibacteria group bacterium]|nr:M15 family metallopeptidase [Patescibacteria group bacterium]
MLRTARALAASLALGAALMSFPASAPSPAAAVGDLPTCRLDDIPTVPRDYDSWSMTLVDWILDVGPDYKPPDLVSISNAGVTGGGQIRKVAFDDLQAMANAARAAGTPLGNVSSYRSYRTQAALFNSYVNGYGFKRAITFSARPGHSEHQLGLTIDFAPGGRSVFVSEDVGAGKWLSNNAWKYGWLMSYPKGKKALTCYRYEPWHYRYFGRDLAKAIHDSGLTTREYLWSHFTQVVVPPAGPVPSASAAPPASPVASAPATGAPETPSASPSFAPASAPLGSPVVPTPAPARNDTILGLAPPVAIVLGGLVVVLAGSVLGLRMSRRRRA